MGSETEANTPTPGQTGGTNGTGGQSQGNGGARGQSTDDRRGRGGNNNNNSNGYNYLRNFKGEVPDVGAVLGTGTEQKDMKDRYQTFIDKLVSYVSRTASYPKARDLEPLLTDLEDVRARLVKQMPSAPVQMVDDKGVVIPIPDSAKQYYQIKLKAFVERENHLENNIFQLYKLVWGQLSQALQNRVKREQDWKSKKDASDVVWLLTTIKKLAANVDHTNNAFKSAVVCMRALLAIKQGRNETVDNYRKRYEGIVDTLAIIGLKDIFRHKGFADSNANGDLKKSEEALSAMCFFLGADPGRFSSLFGKMDTDVLLGNDNYPTDLGQAFDVLCRYSGPKGRRTDHQNGRPQQHYSFFQADGDGELCPGADGRVTERDGRAPRCYNCNKLGHLANNCPDPPRRGGTQSVLVRYSLAQNSKSFIIDPNWILLDTCSTVTSFMNPKLMDEIEDCAPGEEMKVLANGNGEQDYFQKGVDKYLSLDAYLNEDSIANIVSMADAAKKYRVTMDTAAHGTNIFLHLDNDKQMKFKQCGQGLYYFNTAEDNVLDDNDTNEPVSEYTLVNTVKENKKYFSKQEIERADRARLLQQILDWPSSVTLKSIVSHNQLRNCPITASDVDRADVVYGPAVPICKGKMVRQKPKHYRAIPRVPLPLNLIKEHSTADIHVDFFFVNGVPYLHTKCKPQDFVTVRRTRGRGLKAVKHELDGLKTMYEQKGFTVGGFHGDNEFRPLINYYSPIPVHITAAGEHNGVIERSIRTFEERARCSSHGGPFPKVPHIMMEHLLYRITTSLNAFPTSTGISSDLSPAAIILQTPNLDYNNIQLPYGAYCQAYTRTDNSMRTRSVGAIALRPSNERGGYYFMSLNTGKQIHAFVWKELPIDDHVIDRVVELANLDNAPLMNNGPIFEWRPGVPVLPEDDDFELHDDDYADSDDHSYTPSILDDDDDTLVYDFDETIDDLHLQHVDTPLADGDAVPLVEQGAENEPDPTHVATDVDDDEHEDEDDDISTSNSENEGDDTSSSSSENESNESDEDDDPRTGDNSGDEDNNSQRSEPEETETSRPRRAAAGRGIQRLEPNMHGKTHSNTYTQLLQLSEKLETSGAFRNQCYKAAVDTIFAQVSSDEMAMTEEAKNAGAGGAGGSGSKQMSAKKGIKLFGERAVAAIYKEYKQLVDLEVFAGIDPDEIDTNDKRKALNIINTIKQKRCGKIKGRSVADGRKQRGYVTKEESSSPTLLLEALLVTTLIDAVEDRDVCIFDVPGAFLQASFPDEKFVLVRIEGEFVDIMCKVNPELKQYVRFENGKKVLYLRLLKALYGCMESALLWYNLYTTTLATMGFELNPYDRCVANRMVEDNQQTLCFYVDDNKISHKNRDVNVAVMDRIEEYFGKLETSYGKEHSFLGMMIRFIGNGKFEIDMTEYQMEAIEAFEEDEKSWKKVSSPATKDLKTIRKADKLDQDRAEKYHSVVSKLLWIAKRGRPDLDPAVSFLCTRVKSATNDDWRKLRRVLQYMHQTIHEKRVIGADNLYELFTWIDAAYAVHDDMRSHTGGAMSFGYGIIHYLSAKQKLNVKSSTEAELVGMSDYLPFNIWLRLFLESQGYYLRRNVIYQDNKSAIRMERNGRTSCTGNSRHVHIRFFFVKDHLDKGEFTIEYCPTERMLADYYTKPLQGRLFRLYRAVIMGWKHISTLRDFAIASQERVGEVNPNQNPSHISRRTYTDIVKNGNGNERDINEERDETSTYRENYSNVNNMNEQQAHSSKLIN